MPRIEKTSPLLNLTNFQTFITDIVPNSEYFKLSEVPTELTAGKNGFLIEGCPHLKPTTEIKIEVLDVDGNPLYVEPGEGIPEYYEGLSKLISMHVYQSTPIGVGRITILGELKTYVDVNGITQPIPKEWQGIYNVKWEKDVKINKNIQNESRVRFIRRPEIIIEEEGDIFYSKVTETATQADGTVRGYPLIPAIGTDLNNYAGGIQYVIENQSANFVDGAKRISIPAANIVEADVLDYLTESSILIGVPYIDGNNTIQSFSDLVYSLTYEYDTSVQESSVFGSFARFEINNLATFVGDVERIKVYSKSRASAVNYELLQDTRVDSANLLTTIISGSSVNVGNFTSSYLGSNKTYTDYWVTQSSIDISLDDTSLYKSIKFRNNKISSSLGDNIRLEANSEYTINFWAYYSGSTIDASDKLKVYLTSTTQTASGIADYILTEPVATIYGNSIYKFPKKITYNFLPPITDNWTLNIESINTSVDTYWNVGGVTLVGSNELGYSPDEFTFTIPITRTLERETFDFKIEYYDINNNYVPIKSESTKTFVSGNITLLGKSTDISVDNLFFRFDSASMGYPLTQSVNINIIKNKIIGSLLITSGAFDTGGFYIPTSSYTSFGYAYPGVLSSYTESAYSASGTVLLADFTGALHPNPIVDKIVYTVTDSGSLYPVSRTFTIFRVKDGVDGTSGASGSDGEDGLPGVTGPGVVFTGIWEPNRFYQFSSGSGGRRDVVLWNTSGVGPPYDTYYATLRAHTSDTTGSINTIDGSPSQSLSTGSTWEYLGTQDFFVAAKIAIFEESYIQNTLNIGTNNNGGTSSANITLAGGTQYPYISLGQTPVQGYGQNGIWIGNNSGSFDFSLVSGSASSIKWSGSLGTLLIQGTVSASSIIGGTGDFSGNITASAGRIGGWELSPDSIYSVNTSMSIDSSNASIIIYSGSTPSIAIRPGQPSSLDGATISMSPSSVSTSGMGTGIAPNTILTKNGDSSSFVITSGDEGIYFGQITSVSLSGGDLLLYLNAASGLIYISLEIQIASDDLFSNVIHTSTLGAANGPHMPTTGYATFYPQSPNISVNITTAGTYYYRLRWYFEFGSGAGTVDIQSKTSNVTTPIQLDLPTYITEISDGAIQVARSATYYVKLLRDGGSPIMLDVGGEIVASGNITAFYTSDIRLKSNVKTLTDALDRVNRLNGVEFDWKDGFEDVHSSNGHDVGLIAQDVEQVLPEVVTTREDGYKAIKYEKVVSLLVEAIKELRAEINLLKNK